MVIGIVATPALHLIESSVRRTSGGLTATLTATTQVFDTLSPITTNLAYLLGRKS